jgi:DNA replication protein DnaC
MALEVVKEQMRRLLLTTAANELEETLSKQKKAVSMGWLSELLEKELDSRRANSIAKRIKLAGFPEVTSLENFDWDFNEKISREKIEELATLKFIDNNEIVLMLGGTGTGKTHLGIAIGVLATQRGHRVYWTSVKRLTAKIQLARRRNNLDKLFKTILTSKLWILDDIFDLLDRRKHSCALLLTSNRAVEEWPQVFPDPIIANAAIDRLFERAHTTIFRGPSYRLKGRIICNGVDTADSED